MKCSVRSIVVIALVAVLSGGQALAGGGKEHGHADILVSQSVLNSNRLITGAFEFKEFEVISASQRIFESDLEKPFADADLLIGEQGFVTLSGQAAADMLPARLTNLAGNTDLLFDFNAFEIDGVTSNLWYWDGAGGVNFGPATGVTLTLDKLGAFQATVDGSANDVPGFVIETTDANGFSHIDLDVILDDFDADPNTALPLGIYAVSLTMHHNPHSPPAYVLYNTLGEDGEEFVEAAEEYFEEFVVPEPATLSMLGLGMLFATRRRRSSLKAA